VFENVDDLISTYEKPRKKQKEELNEEPVSQGRQRYKKHAGEGKAWVNFWGR
jgi:hypothetical protein